VCLIAHLFGIGAPGGAARGLRGMAVSPESERLLLQIRRKRDCAMFTSTPSGSSTPLSAGTPMLQAPTSAGWKTGAAPHPGQREAGAASSSLPWQRLDAIWPPLPESSTGGLDFIAQRLVRRCLIEAVGKRLKLRRDLPPESLRLWEMRPRLAQYVRQRRFFKNMLPSTGVEETRRLLSNEVALAVEVLEMAPGKLGAEVWMELLGLQCQRIGQLYAHLRERLGAQAQQEIAWAFQRVPGCQV